MNTFSKKNSSFQAVQGVFTQHMRDPVSNPAPGDVEGRRMQIYSDLIYNNIQSFLANSFPVIRQIMTDEQWHTLLRDYVKRHQSRTPLFPRMPLEFVQYLEQECEVRTYPFLAELAHYEWIETSLSLDNRRIEFENVDPEGDLLAGIPVVNPLSVPLHYQWPVHLISPDYLPGEKPEAGTYIIVYRKADDDVAFMVLNHVAARLIQKIIENKEKTGLILLTEISKELQHPNPAAVIDGGIEIMSDMRCKTVLLGTRLKC